MIYVVGATGREVDDNQLPGRSGKRAWYYEMEGTDHDRGGAPERLLFRRVILQALIDATWRDPRPYDQITSSSRDSSRRRMRTNRAEALAWLRGNSEDFKLICDLSGIDHRQAVAIGEKFVRSCNENQDIRENLIARMNGSDVLG